MEAVIQKTARRGRQRAKSDSHITLDTDLLLKLYELLQGERDMVRVYSNSLGSELCFVNPEFPDSEQVNADCPVYTTRELAYIISLSREDFLRFHYLKTRLVG